MTVAARGAYPTGVPCWVDHESPDPAAAIDFYAGLFGWQVEDRLPASGGPRYAVATLGGLTVAAIASDRGAGAPPAWNTYVRVADADAVGAAVEPAGGTLVAPPESAGPAGRSAILRDPAGAELRIWEPGTNGGAEAVNADGTWNWSNLHTPDLAGARAFYGALFGWELDTFDLGGAAAHMWRRPGYGDHLAGREPGIRERQDDSGAPPGFADAVAWLEVDGIDQLPHWHVTFAVADAAATAARAEALGGTISVEPQRVGPTDVAELRDPLGAPFTVNHFDPARLTAG
jgi:predicted enzyme related to lactoylglutathione lyase